MLPRSNFSENRSFGRIFSAFAALLYLRHGWVSHEWPIGVPLGVLLVLGISQWLPMILDRPRKAWIRLGDAIGWVTQPLVLGLLFFFLFTPLGAWRRWRGRSPILGRTGGRSFWLPVKNGAVSESRLRKQY